MMTIQECPNCHAFFEKGMSCGPCDRAELSRLRDEVARLRGALAGAKLEGVELLWKLAHAEWQKTDRGDWIQEFQDAYESAQQAARAALQGVPGTARDDVDATLDLCAVVAATEGA